MLLDQPLARPTEIHVGTVDQQFHGSARGGRHRRQPYDLGTSANGGMVAALALTGSGTASSTPSNWTMEPTKPPVWRSGSRNTARKVNAAVIARQRSTASGVNQSRVPEAPRHTPPNCEPDAAASGCNGDTTRWL
jgi:hypothetical protein